MDSGMKQGSFELLSSRRAIPKLMIDGCRLMEASESVPALITMVIGVYARPNVVAIIL